MDVMLLTLMFSFLIFVCILNYHLSAGVQVSLIDNSVSKTCQKGLWADRDWLNLTMIVDTKGEVITPRSVMTVSFRERERIGKREIEVCSFVYKTECLVKKIHGCFCYETNGEKYYIQYIEIAKLQYSRNYVIFNNGKPNETMVLPPIVNDNITVTFGLNRERPYDITNSNCNCTFSTTLLLSNLDFCVWGLSYPKLRYDFGGSVDDCLTIEFVNVNETMSLSVKYEDSCNRSRKFTCYVYVIQYIITVKTTTTAIFNSTVPFIETPQTEVTRSTFSVASILLALIVLAVCSFGLYYYYTHYHDSGTQGEDENQVKETELDRTDEETSGSTTDIVSVKSKIEPF
ncbi:hypothetical protein Bpfe_000679 [Biomphalaria pfeifferi]|uniref:Uncharacterized protein n=1 Tax=Biomphalaria pfeifferi TaxID=112525 RepID=A0AAD8CBE8_BIOPF|nr:hypothetical protein Bpfe_000679 [Biomphalaria pfeifferi]